METNSNANLTPVRQVVERFLVAKQLEGCAKDTIRFYRENLVRFLWWGERNALPDEVSKIDVQHLRDFLYYVQTAKERFGGRSVSARRPASPDTVDAYWRTLQSLFAWLVREGIVAPDKNPMVRIPRPRVPEKVTQDIPLDLISKVLESYDNSSFLSVRNRAIILVLLDTGVRLAGCANIKMEDVDFSKGIIRVWGKGGKQLLLKLGALARQALAAYILRRPAANENYLWVNDKGERLQKGGLQALVRRLRRFGGNVRWSQHTFRNTFAINLLRQGGDHFTLQILGGWADLDMPRHYCAALKTEDAFRVHGKASPADGIVARNLCQKVEEMRKRIKRAKVDILRSQPNQGNIKGGISTLEEKSLGGIGKAGSTPIRGVLEWGERPRTKGLFFMDGSANTQLVIVGLAAAGAQVMSLSFGGGVCAQLRTSTINTAGGGLPVLPIIKTLSNPQSLSEVAYFDVYVGGIIEGRETVAEAGKRLIDEIIAVASGKMTKLESIESPFKEVWEFYTPGLWFKLCASGLDATIACFVR